MSIGQMRKGRKKRKKIDFDSEQRCKQEANPGDEHKKKTQKGSNLKMI